MKFQAKILDLQTNKIVDISRELDHREECSIWIFNKLRNFMEHFDDFQINFRDDQSRYLIKKSSGEVLDVIGIIYEVKEKINDEEDLI